MLYRPEAFEELAKDPWNEARVRLQVREIAADADATFDAARLWPVDARDADTGRPPVTNLYVGAAGVVWALDILRRRGLTEVQMDLEDAALCTLDAWRAEPDFAPREDVPMNSDASLLMGETGILIVAWRLTPSSYLADCLQTRVLANRSSRTNELMWGVPGTMLAARAMFGWTHEQRWAEAWRESADVLWEQRNLDGLWTQQLHGTASRILGPIHGSVGNAVALRQGGNLLSPERRAALERATSDALARAAVIEGDLANWPREEGVGLLARDGEIRVQWCHGAPGILSSTPSDLGHDLLLAGAELTWRAGALRKGPGLCHGTAGNGYAFLKVFECTGDELWLERARQFAVHALAQVKWSRLKRGYGRYSLWTGDIGAAIFASDCLDCRTAVPIIDYWDA